MLSPAIQLTSRFALASAAASITAEAFAADKGSVSPRIKAAVISAFPAFVPAKPAASAAREFWTKRIPDDDDVLELPKVVVQEQKLKAVDGLTLKGKTEQYMNEYLGSKTGFDRGFLNKHPMNWDVGLGHFLLFGAMTNEDRALEARFDDQRLKHREDLLTTVDLLAVADPEKAKWLKAQSRDLFYRKPDIRDRKR